MAQIKWKCIYFSISQVLQIDITFRSLTKVKICRILSYPLCCCRAFTIIISTSHFEEYLPSTGVTLHGGVTLHKLSHVLWSTTRLLGLHPLNIFLQILGWTLGYRKQTARGTRKKNVVLILVKSREAGRVTDDSRHALSLNTHISYRDMFPARVNSLERFSASRVLYKR